MEPVTLAAAALISAIDWKKIFKGLATDAANKGAKNLLKHLKPDEREKTAKQLVQLFAEEFLTELEDKTPLAAAIPGYHDQLKQLIEHAAPDIVAWLQPETKEVDLAPVERMWNGLKLDPLPEEFDWTLVAKSYARDIRKLVKADPTLREQLNTALLEQQTELQKKSADLLTRIAGVDPGFDLAGYRQYLGKKCALLQLSAMHSSTYDRRVNLWSIFVPQSARESALVRDLPREILRRFRQEGHIQKEYRDDETQRLRETYQNSPVSPVLEILKRNRLTVVLGDPGSGKTSLLKFCIMKWTGQEPSIEAGEPLPIWIDLKEYVQDRRGFLQYAESSCTAFGLSSADLERRLRSGSAALYLDGLDEIFDGPTRGLIIEELIAFASRYVEAPVVVTSRIVGYQPDLLRNAGFVHATLEDFDDRQVSEFLYKWHDASEDDAKERNRLLAQLERALRDSRAVRELAGNPLLLTMMAILNRNQELPRDRVELYAQASRVLLHEWDASRSLPVDKFARQEKEEILRELAGSMQQREGGLAGNLIERAHLVDLFRGFLKRLDIPDPHGAATTLVTQLNERNFILCFAGADRFSFVHRTFLEYFCASWFVELFQKKQTLTLEELKNNVFGPHWRDETWHEVLRLIAGMVGEKQAEQLILFLMEQDGANDQLANLKLAAGCLSEVRNRREIQATDDTLWRRFTEEVMAYDANLYQFEEEGEPTPPTGPGLTFVWRTETTLAWLKAAAVSNRWLLQITALRELARGWKEDPQTLVILKARARSDYDYDVRATALQEWARGWKNDPDTLSFLKDRARSDGEGYLRFTAVQELARGWRDDPDTLPFLKDRAHSDDLGFVRRKAVQEWARGWKDDPDTLPFLKDRARSDNEGDVRATAVYELAQGWKDDPGTLPLLKDRARSDNESGVRGTALIELARGWKDDPDTLPLLKDRARSDNESGVRGTALIELARGWKNDPDTLPLLKDRARSDEDFNARATALIELASGWKDTPDILPFLKDRTRSDEDSRVRSVAIQELANGWNDDPDVIAFLQSLEKS